MTRRICLDCRWCLPDGSISQCICPDRYDLVTGYPTCNKGWRPCWAERKNGSCGATGHHWMPLPDPAEA